MAFNDPHASLLQPYPPVGEYSQSLVPLFARVIAVTVFITFLYFVRHDYYAFKALGPGGTPSTPLGYVRIKFLGLFALRNPYRPPPISPSLQPRHGHLVSLTQRFGPRPAVRGIAPQRQVSQRNSPDMFSVLAKAIRQLAANPQNKLALGTSCFEKHGTGLFSLAPIARTCRGEICHVHPSDGSLHLTLHPADAAIVLQSGWGQRHPLARGGWLSRFVPEGFIMVYAPRDEKEVEVVIEIVRAACWFVSGVDAVKRETRLQDDQVGLGDKVEELYGSCGITHRKTSAAIAQAQNA